MRIDSIEAAHNNAACSTPESTIKAPGGVQNGSVAAHRDNGVNLGRLRLVMTLFRLQNSDIQKHTGFSKAYISGVVSGKVRGSQQFWIKLNSVLPSIITAIGSGCCVFEI